MIRRLIARIKLRFEPPKVGDVYYGDPFDFLVGRPIERVLHGLNNKCGDHVWEPLFSEGCYRLKITSDSMPYYICQVEVLAHKNFEEKAWKKRSQPRRFDKKSFCEMIVNGSIKHE